MLMYNSDFKDLKPQNIALHRKIKHKLSEDNFLVSYSTPVPNFSYGLAEWQLESGLLLQCPNKTFFGFSPI